MHPLRYIPNRSVILSLLIGKVLIMKKEFKFRISAAFVFNLVIISTVLLLLSSSETLSKYVLKNSIEMKKLTSTVFFMTSDYLNESNDIYTVYTSDGAEVTLFNYDTDNTSLYSVYQIDCDVTLTYYSASDFSSVVILPKDKQGDNISLCFPLQIEEGEYKSASFNVPFCEAARYVQVTAESTSPYRKTISARLAFDITSEYCTYTAERVDNVLRITIMTGSSVSEEVLITWPEGYSPDSSNPLMSGDEWLQGGSSAVIRGMEENSTYILDFFGTGSFEEVNTPATFTDEIKLN